jgi:formate dehydrogenase subunit gamma
VLFFVSGLLLWYGERDTRFRLGGTVFLHDTLMYLSVAIVAGHLYLALIHPTTRHALRGMTLGSVREDWARRHHEKWQPLSAQDEHPALGLAPAVRAVHEVGAKPDA